MSDAGPAQLLTKWTGRFAALEHHKRSVAAIEPTVADSQLDPEPLGSDSPSEADSLDLKAALLARLHALSPRGFEDFVVHLLTDQI